MAISPILLTELSDPQRYQAKIFRQITLAIFGLSVNPRPHNSKKIDMGYRVDTGEYRIYYEVNDDLKIVTVLLVGKRNDDEVYKQLKRRFR